MARERAAERAQGGHQIGARPFVRRCEDFVDGLRLGIHDQAVEPLERLREQRRAATRDVKDDADRRRIARCPADAVPGDVHDPLLGRHARDSLLHERVLQLVAADPAQRQV